MISQAEQDRIERLENDKMDYAFQDSEEPEYCTDANQLTDSEIRDFVDSWLNDETANDDNSLEYMTIYAWFKDYPLSYDLQTWAKKWARQAAFEAQLPALLKQQASIN